jgi:hypothetical protein
MQKVLFITTILLTLFALSIRAEHNPRKRPDVSAQFQTVSGHSISLNGIGPIVMNMLLPPKGLLFLAQDLLMLLEEYYSSKWNHSANFISTPKTII